MCVDQLISDAIWVARTLFELQRATGSTSNLSFRVGDVIYITASNSSFGRLKAEDFAIIDLNGCVLNNVKPSKEYPLHIMLYENNLETGAVIHTHSHYSTIWSMEQFDNHFDIVPTYTPYLNLKLGKIRLVPYEQPGTKELFDAFKKTLHKGNGYLLAHHGPIVGDSDILSAFYSIEELEASCRIAWSKRNQLSEVIINI